MMTEEKLPEPGTIEVPQPQHGPHRAMHLLIALVIFSLIAGAAAGFGAGFVAVRVNQHVNSTAKNAHSKQQAAGTLPPQDPSATSGGIVAVVQQASQAVVSITVSEKTSEVNQDDDDAIDFGEDPGDGYGMDPFGNFPDSSSGNSTNQQPPNSSGTDGYEDVAAGSGFFVTSDGLILTNKHVVSLSDDAKYTVTTADGKTYDATVAATDPINDLALVKISISNAPTLQLSDSSTIEIGQQVIAIGNSLGEYQNTVTSGIVSGIGRNVTAGSDDGSDSAEELDGVIQTDAAINPGNSGGPLLNSAGQVIGVNTAVDEEGQLVGFAIPSNFAGKDIASFQSTGKIIKPFLGLSYISIDADSQKEYGLPVSVGAYITASSGSPIIAGSAADKAGLKAGDIITSVNGQAIDVTHTLSQLLQQFNPNDKISLGILRDGKQMSVSVTLGSKE